MPLFLCIPTTVSSVCLHFSCSGISWYDACIHTFRNCIFIPRGGYNIGGSRLCRLGHYLLERIVYFDVALSLSLSSAPPSLSLPHFCSGDLVTRHSFVLFFSREETTETTTTTESNNERTREAASALEMRTRAVRPWELTLILFISVSFFMQLQCREARKAPVGEARDVLAVFLVSPLSTFVQIANAISYLREYLESCGFPLYTYTEKHM